MKRGTIGFIVCVLCVMVVFQGGTPLEKQAFVTSMGIDRTDDGRLRVSVQLPAVESSSQDGSASTSSNYVLVDSVADTFVDAIEKLSASIPRVLSFSQLLQIIVSEELARESIFLSVMEDILSTRNIRQSATVVVSHGTAFELIDSQKPFLGIRLSESIKTSLDLFNYLDGIPKSELGEVVRVEGGAWRDLLLPYAALSSASENPTDVATTPGRPLDSMPVILPPTNLSHVEYLGAAIYKNGQMIGTLTGMEMLFASYLSGTMHRFTYYVDGKYYRVEQILPARLSVDTSEAQWKLMVNGTIHISSLRYDGMNLDIDRFRDAFNQECINLIEKFKALGVDPLGFQGKAVRSVWTMSDWSQEKWDRAYQDAAIELRVAIIPGEAE